MSSSDRIRWIFVGSAGIRAGWSALIFVVLMALQIGLVFWIVKLATHGADLGQMLKREIPVSVGLINETVLVVAMVVATWVMARIEGRTLLDYGFGGPQKLRLFALGAGAGVLAMLALVAFLTVRGNLVIEGRDLHGSAILVYAAVWGFNFFLVGIAEEGTLRGYLQYTLKRGINFFWAAVILSIAFGAFHSGNPGESRFGLVNVVAIGLILCFSLWLTGSLWWAVGIHAAWDWMQSYTFGVADSGLRVQGHLFASHPVGPALLSGGTTGPEGSVYSLVVLAALTAGLYLAWGRRPAGIGSR